MTDERSERAGAAGGAEEGSEARPDPSPRPETAGDAGGDAAPREADGAETRTVGPFQLALAAPRAWRRVVSVEVDRAHYDREYARQLKAAAREHERPGFRKGKAPRAIVERELGPRLPALVMQTLVPQALKAAIVEHELVPITDPDVGNVVLQPDRPITFDLTFEVRPKITARDYEELPLQRPQLEVRDEEVDEVLERLRESRAPWERADRPAQAGDRLLLDLVPLKDGEPDEAALVPDQRLLVGASTNIEAFEEGLRGAAAGEERRVEVSYPEDHHAAELRGTSVTYLCRVKAVERKVLPELDDAFAASLEPGQTLLELRGKIRADLQRELEQRIQRDLEEQAVDRLIERNEIEVPPSLVQQYVASGLEELHGRNAQMGRPSSPEQDEDYRRTTGPIAERILKGMFIMEAIRRQEGLKVSEEEVEAEIDEVAARHGFDPQKYRDYAAKGDERDRIRHALEERKAFAFLLSRARIEEVEPGELARRRAAAAGGPAAGEAGPGPTPAGG